MSAVQALAHRARVMDLYRNSLRTCLSWAVDREVFFAEAEKIRTRFDENKNISDFAVALDKVKKGEAELAGYAHPDMYTIPTNPGGSKYQRNIPPPPELAH